MRCHNSDAKTNRIRKQKRIEEKFESLRDELNKYVHGDGEFSNNDHILELSRQLDLLHLEYMKLNK